MTRDPNHELSKSGEVLQQTGWLDAANYEFTHGLTRRDWAWEFLRRNKDYGADWALSEKETTIESQDNRFVDAGASRMQRWGLIFRRRTG